MLHTLYIGPYYSMSTAGFIFRRLIDALIKSGANYSYSATSFTDLYNPPYALTQAEEMNFLEVSASKQAHLAMKDAQIAATLLVNSIQDLDEKLLEGLFESGIVPALVIVCGQDDKRLKDSVYSQNSKLRQAGIDVVYLDEPGLPDSGAALWRAKAPIAQATTNMIDNTDVVMIGFTLDDLIQVSKKIAKDKTLYIYDPGNTLQLNYKHPALKQVKEALEKNGNKVVPFTYSTSEELLAITEGKSVVVPTPKDCLLLGAMVEKEASASTRVLELASDARIVTLHKFPQVQQQSMQEAVAMAMKQVPDMPEAMKNAKTS